MSGLDPEGLAWFCFTFLHCAFLNVSSKRLHKSRHNHTGCICLIFLRCVFSNASSNCLDQSRHNHTGCICLTFLHCGFSNVSSNCLPGWIHDHIGCISPLCIFKCVLKWMRERMHNHTGCICLTFLHCWFSNVSSKRWH